MAKYTWIERERCIGCGGCYATAPDIYGHDHDGYALVTINGDANRGITEIPVDLYDDLEDALDGCPTLSVRVSEHPFNREG